MHNYPEHYTKNALSAIKLAEKLKAKKEYDFFRGQTHTFSIQPSIARKAVNKEEAADQIARFAYWVHNTPELKSLHNNQNAILAVAQHYGLKTPLLDFTSSPVTAGFFATSGGKKGDTGTIICLNKERFKRSWKDINQQYFKDKGAFLTEIVEIDVKNLWRLQAQEGMFLRCHVDAALLEMFSCFLHIYFPQTEKKYILNLEQIYPTAKSHLEVLLDQYFLIESYPERKNQMEKLFGKAIVSISENDISRDIKSYFFNDQLPSIEKSWKFETTNSWLLEPDERYSEINSIIEIPIILSSTNSITEFESHVQNQLKKIFKQNEAYRKNLSWQVKSDAGLTLYIESDGSLKDRVTQFTSFTVAQMLDSIYSGMRTLPYTEDNILTAISRYLTLVKFRVYEVIKDAIGIELSGGGIRGRGFCSEKKLKKSLRDDYFTFIKPTKLDSNGGLDVRDILFTARHIKHSYNFEKFVNLFIEDIIPTQAVVAIEGLVIVTNPMRIDVLGES